MTQPQECGASCEPAEDATAVTAVTSSDDIDLFSGPGGWEEGVRALGRHPLGIEWDETACATGRAAGHRRLQADIAELTPSDHAGSALDGGPPSRGRRGGRVRYRTQQPPG